MCNKFKFSHHELHPYWTSHIRELNKTGIKDEYSPIVDEGDKKDILASSTDLLKFTFEYFNSVYEKIKETKCFKVLTNTTQPAHVAIMLIALVMAATIHSAAQNSNPNNITWKFVYMAATAAHFGSQIWMTFVSGLSLYFSLPRHHFGEVQKVLFPLYFTLTSFLSLVTFFAHLRLTKTISKTVLLFLCFVVELVVRLYFCNPLVRLICVKNDMEAKHGLGMEIGKLSRNSALFQSHEYLKVHRRFRRLHMFIALSNIACIGFSTAHLYLAVFDVNLGS